MKGITFQGVIIVVLFLCAHQITNAQTNKGESQLLTPRQEAIVLTSAFSANGDLENLKGALHEALDAKLTVNETKEVIVHVYAYTGFPRSIRGLQTLMAVLEERKATGVKDEVGREAKPIPNEQTNTKPAGKHSTS